MGDSTIEEKVDVTLVENIDIKVAEEAVETESTSSATTDLPDKKASKYVDNFELGELIAEGTASRIYHAKNESMEGNFALKIISQDLYRTEAAATRLLNSLRAASQVTNPYLATIYDCGRTKDGSIYVVTDYIKGRTLKDLIASGELLQGQRFIEIFRQLTQALKSLHHHNIVHGDLKPGNIFIVDTKELEWTAHDFIKVVDYGIAGALTEVERLEYLKLSSKDGCPNYMSPEQCLSFALDARSDIYSMGLVMHEALTGSPLVGGHSQVHAILRQLNLKPSKLKESGWQISDSLERVLMKCLEKNRSARYFAIEDLELDLELAANDLSNLPGLADNAKSNAPPEAEKKALKVGKKQIFKKRKVKILAAYTVLTGVICGALAYGPGFKSEPFKLKHEAEQEMGHALNLLNDTPPMATPGEFSQYSQDMMPWRGPHRRNMDHALFHANKAEEKAQRAVLFYAWQHPFASGHRFKHNMAQLQTFMGELYLRDMFDEYGARRDSSTWYPTGNSATLELSSRKMYPSFPGLLQNSQAMPDYQAAEAWFNKAAKTLKRTFCENDLKMLWEAAYTNYQLNPKSGAVIAYHRAILDVLSKADTPDFESMIMAHRNIASIYLNTGQYEKAIKELQKAKSIDSELNKIPATYSSQLDAEIAFAFLKEGKFDVAEKLAASNLQRIEQNLMDTYPLTHDVHSFNIEILTQALALQGKTVPYNALAPFSSSAP